MTPVSLAREIAAALVDEIGIVLGAMIDSPAAVAPGAPPMGHQWVAEVGADGAVRGTVTMVFDHDGVVAATRAMTGAEGAVADDVLNDTLREVLQQAVSALALKPVARGAALSLVRVVRSESRPPEGQWTALAISIGALAEPLALSVWGELTDAAPAASQDPVESRPAAVPSPGVTMDERIAVLLDIDLPLVVRFGRTELPLRALARLGPGSVIDLGRPPDEPVEVLVGNRVVAKGEVVVVSGNYGIRILDVVSQRERASSMEV